MNKKKILIIGGNGFIGSYLAELLKNKKHEVTIFDKQKSLKKKNNIKYILSDINNYKKLEKAIKSSNIIYHFAGISDIGEAMENPIKSCEVNIVNTLKILELCVKYKVERFIFSSTIYVHSEQGGFYKITKQASELYIEEFNRRFSLKYSILRFGTVYGYDKNKKNNLSKIVFNAIKKKQLKYSGGTSKALRRYIHVKDAAKLSYKILSNKFINKNILITGKKNIRITKIMQMLSKILAIDTTPQYEKITQLGHYNISPYTYKKKPEINLFPKKEISIREGLLELTKKYK